MEKFEFKREPINVEKIKTNNRIIDTAIPAPGTNKELELLEMYESRSMQGQIPIVWDKAENFNIFDKYGNKWIDFTSTIFVANTGHGNPKVIKSVNKILNKPLLHTYAYINQERSEYHKKLVDFAGPPFEKAFLLSAGTEATEAALKLMRMNGQKIGKKKLGIICIEGNWHGRTMGAQMMSGNSNQKEWIGYQDPNIFHIPFPYPWTIKDRSPAIFFKEAIDKIRDQGVDIKNDVCGFMLEAFQGWGAIFYPKEFVKSIASFCLDNKILLTFDEMQSGFARTGKKFGYEHYEIMPDLICCGKGIASGFSLSAVVGKKEIMDLPEIGNMSSTHSANPVVCAAGSATIDEIENLNLVMETKRKGDLLFDRLNKMKNNFSDHISLIQGKGMIAAIHFFNKKTQTPETMLPSIICEKAMQKGLLLVHTGRESIKIGPPLTISDEALLEGISVIEESIAEAIAQ